MRIDRRIACSLLAIATVLVGCTEAPGPHHGADGGGGRTDSDADYATYGVHNPPADSSCASPDCSYAREPGRPADPIYPEWWQSDWTMYRVFANYADALPPYAGPPPGLTAGTDYEVSSGATYYDSTWRGPSGEGAMMEYYDQRCLPIFPKIPNTFTCAFISLGDTAFFLTYDVDRPAGMPPVCLFSPVIHPPRRDFITHLPWSEEDSAQLGAGAQAYSFWVGLDGGPFQTGVKPDQTNHPGVLFGYAFAPVNGELLPQSFFFSGFPSDPPNAPFVSQNYENFRATQPDPATTWALVDQLDPATLPACTVMGGPSQAGLGAEPQPMSWFDIGKSGAP